MRGYISGKHLLAGLLLLCFAAWAEASTAVTVIYPDSSDPADKRGNYYIKLLELALSKTGVPYTLKPYTYPTSGSRVEQNLQDEQDINLTWALTSREWEETLVPVRISLDKGILGWRLFLINKRDEKIFAGVRSLEALRQYSAGQQRDWSDVAILRANGLTVLDTAVYESMFKMLSVDRFQYFPRGIGEIWDEQERCADLGIEVEPKLALHYAVQTYFFVSKKNPLLHDLLEQGLRAAQKDGSFDKLFEQYNGEAIRRAHLDQRRVFELKVPQ